MKIVKNNRARVLSRPDRSESRIIGIRKDELGNSIYSYEFFFNADMREAINSSSFNVRLCVRTKNKENKTQLFGDLSDKSSKGVIASLYGKTRDNKNKLITSNRDTLVLSKMIDLSLYVNNKKLKNAKRLTDKQLFGTVTKTKLLKLQNFKGKSNTINVLQKNVPNDNLEKSNGDSFQTNYLNSIISTIDPSLMTVPLISETSGDSRKNELFSGNIKSNLGSRLDGIQSGMRSRLESPGNFSFSNQSTTKKLRSNDILAVAIKEVDRKKLICTKIDISDTQIKSRDIFYVTIELVAKNNIVIQSMSFSVRHKRNIDNFYVPREIPTVSLSKSINVNNNDLKISLNNKSDCVKSVEVYQREIRETQNLLSSKFKKLNSHTFKDTNAINSFSIKSAQGSSKTTIVRALPISKTNEVFGNFSSSTLSTKKLQQTYASIISKSISSGIEIRILNYPQNVVGMSLVRKNLTKKEKSFSDVSFLSGKSIDENEVILNTQSQRSSISTVPRQRIIEAVFADTSVINEHTYEYKIKFRFKNGIEKLSSNSNIHKFISPLNFVNIEITNITTDISTNNVSFEINYEIADTETDILFNTLSSLGMSALYSDDISEVKNTLQNLIIFDIERIDKITGLTKSLGLFSRGIVTDNTISISGDSSNLYSYTISPYIVSPDDIFDEIKDIENNTELVGSRNNLRNPSVFSSLRKFAKTESEKSVESKSSSIERFNNNKSIKNFSKSSLTRGTIQPIDTKSNKSTTNLLKSSPTGDSITIDIDTGFKEYKIGAASVSEGGHGGAIVRWRVTEEKLGSSNIDYFVVLAKKQGRVVIAGNCHFINGLQSSFIDYSNVDFIGVIDYSIIPVFLDGTLGSVKEIGKLTQLDKNTNFKRGN